MIVDAHVSVDRERFPIERVMEVLSAARIGQAIIFPDARALDIAAQNAYVLEAAERFPVFPFYYIGGNPFTDTRPEELVIPENLDAYRGIRWHRWVGEGPDRHGALDQAELDWAVGMMESAEFEALMAAVTHYKLPIILEESFAVTLEFVLRFPETIFIVPHLGARSGGEQNVLRALWDHENVYFGTSLALLDESALARVGPHRLLFGSSFPEGDPEMELDKVDRLPVPESIKELIFGDNILSILGGERIVG